MTTEERVAYLEGRVEEQASGFPLLTARVDALGERLDALGVRLDARIDALDQKIDRFRDELSARIDAVDRKLDRKIDSVRDELTRRMNFQFYWLMGVQVTMFVTIVTILTMR